ncbi:MAG: SBBP repeat-containing protein [Acidobacteria bacterium]|nr:SBBP repeat-containing protein [Acidobacteriota bacterium]
MSTANVRPAAAAEKLGKLPLSFEENRGQMAAEVRFFARGQGYGVYLTGQEAVLHLPSDNGSCNAQARLRWLNAQPSTPEPLDALPGKSNYFIGNDPRQWRTDVPTFERVRYRQLYPGIDLIFYGRQRALEYDFVLAPQADAAQINLAFSGADKLELNEQGDLLVHTSAAVVRQHRPVAYQQTAQGRVNVAAEFVLNDDQLSFRLGAYDHSLPVVLDPLVLYSSYLGGDNRDSAYGIAVDHEGSIFLTGQTYSPNFPVKAPVDTQLDGTNDAFVLKLDASGSRLLFSTFIGGRGSNDRGWAIAVDAAGNVYFCGETNSLNFPTANAVQSITRGNGDAFAVKLNIAGNVLLYSTYLGGSLSDAAYAIALDRFDNAYITGRTDSANFPTKNALQANLRGTRDAFILRLDPDGVLIASTYFGGPPATLGGRDAEAGYGIAVDSQQNVYVTGYTSSPQFTVANPVQVNFGGIEDAFIAKLNLPAAQLIYSTYLGGQDADVGRGIAVDAFGNAYVTGVTLSTDFPRRNALQPNPGGAADAFVAKLNAKGAALVYSTTLGGSGDENTEQITDPEPVGSIAVDALGYVYLTGKTESSNFPLARALQPQKNGDNDAFITKLDPAGSTLIYSTYFGTSFVGNNGLEERGSGLAIDGGNVYVTGQMLGSDLFTLAPFQNKYGGGLSDAFITKISTPDITTIAPVSAASFNGVQLAPESIIALFGSGLASDTQAATTLPLPSSLQGSSVKVTDRNGVERLAPLFFVSPNQINLLIPPGTAIGATHLTVTPKDGPALSAIVQIEAAAPALFTATASGQGLAAAVSLRIKADGTQIYERVAEFDVAQQRFVPVPIDLGAATDQTFLLLFGTGLRGRSNLAAVQVRIGGLTVQPQSVGPQGDLVGLDQINLPLPRSLAGSGSVTIELTVDGLIANPVMVSIR